MKGVITSSPEWRMRNSNENYNQDDASYTKEPSDIPF